MIYFFVVAFGYACFFFFQAEDGIRDIGVTGVQTCALPILARGADLLVAEAYFLEREVPYHLDHAALVRHRGELDAARIVVTHMSPDMLARQDESEFECAHDGLVVELSDESGRPPRS